MSRFWLADHVHACALSNGVVLLDLRSDKYLGIGPDQAAVLRLVVVDWPADVQAVISDATPVPTEVIQLAERLVERGLLSRVPSQRDRSVRIYVPKNVTRPVGVDRSRRPSISPLHVFRFVCAVISAALSLRFRPLNVVVERVRARKAAGLLPQEDLSFQEVEELVAAFRYLRPFAFSASRRCVLHALALCNFLAKYGAYPSWVFGVQTNPFAAHSWVQDGCLVFDSTPEDVRRFVPILAV